MSIALNAARAAVEAAQTARNAPLKPRAKGVSADLVTDADAAAEQAAVAVIRTHRPDDAILGEEGANRAGTSARRWLIDGIDGTVAFAAGLRGGWCSAVALEDEHGPLVAAVQDPLGDTYAAARGEGATLNGEPIQLRRRTPARRRARRHVPAPGPAGRGPASARAPTRCWTPPACSATPARARSSSPGSPPAASTPGSSRRPIRGTGCPARCSSPRPAGSPASSRPGTRWHVAGPSALVDAIVELLT